MDLIEKVISGDYVVSESFFQLGSKNFYLKVEDIEVAFIVNMRSFRVQMFIKCYDKENVIEYDDILDDLKNSNMPIFEHEFVNIKLSVEKQARLFSYFKNIEV